MTAIVTLGIGFGATSSIFSVVDAVLLRSLPYPHPERLVQVSGVTREDGKLVPFPMSYQDIQDLGHSVAQLEELVGMSEARPFNMLTNGDAVHVTGEMTGAGYFDLLGVRPRLGRTFTAGEDRPGGERVVLVSEGFWRRQLGGGKEVLQKQIVLDGEPFRVIGVLPQGFRGISDKAEIWLPLNLSSAMLGAHYIGMRSFRWLSALGRLRPAATAAQAASATEAAMQQLEKAYPDSNRNIGARVSSLRNVLFGDLEPSLIALFGAATFVLLIACVNVANLLLFRVTGRQQEIAIRAALGARKSQIVKQLLSESLLLSLLGCGVGLLITPWATETLLSLSGMELKSFLQLGVNLRVMAFMAFVAVLCGLGVGSTPAWMFTRSQVLSNVAGGSRIGAMGFGRQRFQSGLIVAEVALALVLLIGTGLMVRSFANLLRSDLGFIPADLLTMRLDLKGNRYAQPAAREQLARRLLERLEKIPGVNSFAIAGPAIPTDDWYGAQFTFEDRREPNGQDAVLLLRHHVTPAYFNTMRTPILAGRAFTLADAGDTAIPVVILSKSAARRYLGDRDPIGRRIKVGPRSASPEVWLTIVGVAGDIRHSGFGREDRPAAPDVYLPMLEYPPGSPPIFNLLVRSEGSAAAALTKSLRAAVAEVAPDLPLYDVATMESRLDTQASRRRFLVLLVGLFGFFGLALVIIGIYGVLSYAVAQSTREIAVRMAIGAEHGEVRRLVVKRALVLVLLGITLGLILAIALTARLQSLLYGVQATDPATLAAVSGLMTLVGFFASYLPARRATRIDPMRSLRES